MFAAAELPNIEFLGTLVGEEKWRQFSSADIFVLPSHTEDMPVSILEAMAVGLPVIATEVGSIPEVIDHGVSGFLVKPHDAAGLQARFGCWLKISDCARHGRRGKQEIERRIFL